MNFSLSTFAYSWTSVYRHFKVAIWYCLWEGTFFIRAKRSLHKFSTILSMCDQCGIPDRKKNKTKQNKKKKMKFLKSWNFYEFLKKRIFPKKYQLYNPSSWDQIMCLLEVGLQRPYPSTVHVQSILQADISILFARFRFQCKSYNLKMFMLQNIIRLINL